MFTSGKQYPRSRDRLTFDIENPPGGGHSSIACREDCSRQKGGGGEDLSHDAMSVTSLRPHRQPNGPAVHRREPRRDEASFSETSKAAVRVRCNCELGEVRPGYMVDRSVREHG